MSSLETSSSVYEQAGEILTKLTLDARAAVCNVTDQDSRIYAFGLTNLCSTLSAMLTTAVWEGSQTAGNDMLEYIQRFVQREPNAAPEWLKILSSSWELPK